MTLSHLLIIEEVEDKVYLAVRRLQNNQPITNGRVHTGLGGVQRLVARKKSWCTWIIYRHEIPYDTLPSTVVKHGKGEYPLRKIYIDLKT